MTLIVEIFLETKINLMSQNAQLFYRIYTHIIPSLRVSVEGIISVRKL